MTMPRTPDLFDHAPTGPKLAIAFRSGMSRSKDFWAAADAGAAIGVVAGELSIGAIMHGVARFMRKGGELFIDSGAFAELKTGVVPDFDKVLSIYESISDDADLYQFSRANLYIVAPDKVGDQLVTLERIAQHGARIRALIHAGCMVIVPIQRGTIPAAEMLDQVADILGTRLFVAGIPSNKAALSIAECATLNHDRFHILGRVQMNQDQAARLHALTTHCAHPHITADANWLRGRIGEITQRGAIERKERAVDGRRPSFLPSRSIAITAAIAQDPVWAKPC